MDIDNRTAGGYMLAAFRILVGWIFLWPFFDKLFGLGYQTPAGGGWVDGCSPSSYVAYVTDGVFADLFNALAGNIIVDVLFMLALLLIGITLMAGIASKIATVSAVAFLLVMYCLCVPPTDNPLIDYHIILCAGLLAAYFLNGYDRLSLYSAWKEFVLVKKYPILE
ncbi:MAG: hypothetical protein J5707_01740 [Candidatus Methanomethylophilus sp.]|nr:hypothetical protein [Methanomethylophilus sp.]